jgi:ABC-type uncharacterized transport system permease subunit
MKEKREIHLMTPDFTQVALLWAAGVAFAVAFFSAWRQIRAPRPASQTDPAPAGPVLGPIARIAFAVGFVLAVALVAWRVLGEGNRAATPHAPLFNFFDLFLLLGILLAAISVYFRITRRLRSLTFFLLPIIALVFILGGVLALLNNRAFEYHSVASALHIVSIIIAFITFALGCAGGIVYLLADRQLKTKGGGGEHRLLKFPSLASIERFNLHAVLIGFPLLTVAMITGGIILYARTKDASWTSPKVLLAIASWLIYGVLIHIPLAPSFRGRRAAWLIIVGFVMLLSVFFAIRS